jgi:hypothetical protein
LKLFLSPVTSPSGAIDIYPVTGDWSESTLNPSSPPALSSTAFATMVPTGKANSFLVLDVTQLVQAWLKGAANGGLDNNGIALVANTSTTYVVFDSKESIVTSHEPRLEIVLVGSGPQGPPGTPGAPGSPGQPGQTGQPGTPGAAATVQVGTTMTVPAGTPAAVLNGGTPNAAVLNFLIPQGASGLPGLQGPQGPAGISNKGNWSSPAAYNQSDAVFASGSYWLATAANTNSLPSATNTAWQLLAAGINNRGAWDKAANYEANDAVADGGSYWLALAANNASQPSGTNTNWQLLAAQGVAGPAGINGTNGANGINGIPGIAATVSVGTTKTSAPGTSAQVSNTGSPNAAFLNFTIPQGAQGPGGVNGTQEFISDGLFTVADGITKIMVEMWGTGTNGVCVNFMGSLIPFGGGGGAYTRTVISVTPGEVLGITTGSQGVDTAVLRGTTVITFAGAGNNNTGGAADPSAAISHPGHGAGSTGGKGYASNLTPEGRFSNGGDGNCSGPSTAGQPGYVLLTW